jgi:hypothetical protein
MGTLAAILQAPMPPDMNQKPAEQHLPAQPRTAETPEHFSLMKRAIIDDSDAFAAIAGLVARVPQVDKQWRKHFNADRELQATSSQRRAQWGGCSWSQWVAPWVTMNKAHPPEIEAPLLIKALLCRDPVIKDAVWFHTGNEVINGNHEMIHAALWEASAQLVHNTDGYADHVRLWMLELFSEVADISYDPIRGRMYQQLLGGQILRGFGEYTGDGTNRPRWLRGGVMRWLLKLCCDRQEIGADGHNASGVVSADAWQRPRARSSGGGLSDVMLTAVLICLQRLCIGNYHNASFVVAGFQLRPAEGESGAATLWWDGFNTAVDTIDTRANSSAMPGLVIAAASALRAMAAGLWNRLQEWDRHTNCGIGGWAVKNRLDVDHAVHVALTSAQRLPGLKWREARGALLRAAAALVQLCSNHDLPLLHARHCLGHASGYSHMAYISQLLRDGVLQNAHACGQLGEERDEHALEAASLLEAVARHPANRFSLTQGPDQLHTNEEQLSAAAAAAAKAAAVAQTAAAAAMSVIKATSKSKSRNKGKPASRSPARKHDVPRLSPPSRWQPIQQGGFTGAPAFHSLLAYLCSIGEAASVEIVGAVVALVQNDRLAQLCCSGSEDGKKLASASTESPLRYAQRSVSANPAVCTALFAVLENTESPARSLAGTALLQLASTPQVAWQALRLQHYVPRMTSCDTVFQLCILQIVQAVCKTHMNTPGALNQFRSVVSVNSTQGSEHWLLSISDMMAPGQHHAVRAAAACTIADLIDVDLNKQSKLLHTERTTNLLFDESTAGTMLLVCSYIRNSESMTETFQKAAARAVKINTKRLWGKAAHAAGPKFRQFANVTVGRLKAFGAKYLQSKQGSGGGFWEEEERLQVHSATRLQAKFRQRVLSRAIQAPLLQHLQSCLRCVLQYHPTPQYAALLLCPTSSSKLPGTPPPLVTLMACLRYDQYFDDTALHIIGAKTFAWLIQAFCDTRAGQLLSLNNSEIALEKRKLPLKLLPAGRDSIECNVSVSMSLCLATLGKHGALDLCLDMLRRAWTRHETAHSNNLAHWSDLCRRALHALALLCHTSEKESLEARATFEGMEGDDRLQVVVRLLAAPDPSFRADFRADAAEALVAIAQNNQVAIALLFSCTDDGENDHEDDSASAPSEPVSLVAACGSEDPRKDDDSENPRSCDSDIGDGSEGGDSGSEGGNQGGNGDVASDHSGDRDDNGHSSSLRMTCSNAVSLLVDMIRSAETFDPEKQPLPQQKLRVGALAALVRLVEAPAVTPEHCLRHVFITHQILETVLRFTFRMGNESTEVREYDASDDIGFRFKDDEDEARFVGDRRDIHNCAALVQYGHAVKFISLCARTRGCRELLVPPQFRWDEVHLGACQAPAAHDEAVATHQWWVKSLLAMLDCSTGMHDGGAREHDRFQNPHPDRKELGRFRLAESAAALISELFASEDSLVIGSVTGNSSDGLCLKILRGLGKLALSGFPDPGELRGNNTSRSGVGPVVRDAKAKAVREALGALANLLQWPRFCRQLSGGRCLSDEELQNVVEGGLTASDEQTVVSTVLLLHHLCCPARAPTSETAVAIRLFQKTARMALSKIDGPVVVESTADDAHSTDKTSPFKTSFKSALTVVQLVAALSGKGFEQMNIAFGRSMLRAIMALLRRLTAEMDRDSKLANPSATASHGTRTRPNSSIQVMVQLVAKCSTKDIPTAEIAAAGSWPMIRNTILRAIKKLSHHFDNFVDAVDLNIIVVAFDDCRLRPETTMAALRTTPKWCYAAIIRRILATDARNGTFEMSVIVFDRFVTLFDAFTQELDSQITKPGQELILSALMWYSWLFEMIWRLCDAGNPHKHEVSWVHKSIFAFTTILHRVKDLCGSNTPIECQRAATFLLGNFARALASLISCDSECKWLGKDLVLSMCVQDLVVSSGVSRVQRHAFKAVGAMCRLAESGKAFRLASTGKAFRLAESAEQGAVVSVSNRLDVFDSVVKFLSRLMNSGFYGTYDAAHKRLLAGKQDTSSVMFAHLDARVVIDVNRFIPDVSSALVSLQNVCSSKSSVSGTSGHDIESNAKRVSEAANRLLGNSSAGSAKSLPLVEVLCYLSSLEDASSGAHETTENKSAATMMVVFRKLAVSEPNHRHLALLLPLMHRLISVLWKSGPLQPPIIAPLVDSERAADADRLLAGTLYELCDAADGAPLSERTSRIQGLHDAGVLYLMCFIGKNCLLAPPCVEGQYDRTEAHRTEALRCVVLALTILCSGKVLELTGIIEAGHLNPPGKTTSEKDAALAIEFFGVSNAPKDVAKMNVKLVGPDPTISIDPVPRAAQTAISIDPSDENAKDNWIAELRKETEKWKVEGQTPLDQKVFWKGPFDNMDINIEVSSCEVQKFINIEVPKMLPLNLQIQGDQLLNLPASSFAFPFVLTRQRVNSTQMGSPRASSAQVPSDCIQAFKRRCGSKPLSPPNAKSACVVPADDESELVTELMDGSHGFMQLELRISVDGGAEDSTFPVAIVLAKVLERASAVSCGAEQMAATVLSKLIENGNQVLRWQLLGGRYWEDTLKGRHQVAEVLSAACMRTEWKYLAGLKVVNKIFDNEIWMAVKLGTCAVRVREALTHHRLNSIIHAGLDLAGHGRDNEGQHKEMTIDKMAQWAITDGIGLDEAGQMLYRSTQYVEELDGNLGMLEESSGSRSPSNCTITHSHLTCATRSRSPSNYTITHSHLTCATRSRSPSNCTITHSHLTCARSGRRTPAHLAKDAPKSCYVSSIP